MMQKIEVKAGFCNGKIIFGILIVMFSFLACAGDSENIIVNDSFEEWEWVPISTQMVKQLKAIQKRGEDMNTEVRGPLYRKFKGLYTGGISGYMIEGKDAFKGKSLYLNNNAKGDSCHVIGLFAPYSKLIEPGVKYRYEVHVKGRGRFIFRAWVDAVNPNTGKSKWLGFPDLINIVATEKWQHYSGTFKLPEYDKKPFVLSRKISCAIVVLPGSSIYIDEFKVFKEGK